MTGAMRRVVRPRDGIVAERVGDELLLLDVDAGLCSSLNRTGALLWEALPGTEADLARAVADRYPSAEGRATGDVRSWVDAMVAERWVTVAEESS